MPELPEVEHLKRTLEPALIGARVVSAELRRHDVVHRCGGAERAARSDDSLLAKQLLAGTTITQLLRHGKNLAIIADTGGVVCVHLGMSGSMRVMQHARFPLGDRVGVRGSDASVDFASRVVRSLTPDPSSSQGQRRRGEHSHAHLPIEELKHIHCIWRLHHPRRGESTLIFRDPRRFGGLWLFDSLASLYDERLNSLGPDALTITAQQLGEAVAGSRRPIKAALLDQSALAGVGNIYADEALFAAGIHPMKHANRLGGDQVTKLAAAIRQVLRRSIQRGGTTIRDYADGQGLPGGFSGLLKVYGCDGEPCPRCGTRLRCTTVAQRTTVYCSTCQVRR